VAQVRVNVNLKDSDRRTPLLWALENKREGVIEILLNTGRVDVNSRGDNGQTPL
jgi:ankyrin repeat protein